MSGVAWCWLSVAFYLWFVGILSDFVWCKWIRRWVAASSPVNNVVVECGNVHHLRCQSFQHREGLHTFLSFARSICGSVEPHFWMKLVWHMEESRWTMTIATWIGKEKRGNENEILRAVIATMNVLNFGMAWVGIRSIFVYFSSARGCALRR